MCGRRAFGPIGHSIEGVVLISKGGGMDQWLREGLEPVKHHTRLVCLHFRTYNSLLLHGILILQMQYPE